MVKHLKSVLVTGVVVLLLATACEYPVLNINPLNEVSSVSILGTYDLSISPNGSKGYAVVCTDSIEYPEIFGQNTLCTGSAVTFIDIPGEQQVDHARVSGVILSSAVSPDGRTLVTAGANEARLDCNFIPWFYCDPSYSGGHLTIWNAQTFESETTKLVSAPIFATAFSNDGSLFAAVTATGYLLVWETQSWHLIQDIDIAPSCTKQSLLKFTPDDRYLLISCGPVLVYDTDSWSRASSINILANGMDVSPDGRLLALCNRDSVMLYKVGSWNLTNVVYRRMGRELMEVHFSPDGMFLFVTEEGRCAHIIRTGIWDEVDRVGEKTIKVSLARNSGLFGLIEPQKVSFWEFEK